MEIKNIEQMLKLQKDLTARLTQNVNMIRTGKPPSPELLLKEKEQLISGAQAAVAEAVKERDAAVGRWDDRIAQRQATLAKLESELHDLRELVARPKKMPRAGKTGKAKKETRTKKKP